MIAWMIWPRQYGKTHRLREWWMEDPENRVIITENECIAEHSRHAVLEAIRERHPNWDAPVTKKFLKSRIMSFRSWLNLREKFPDTDHKDFQVAVDGVEHILAGLLKANIAAITGAGRNEEPDPRIAALAAARHSQFAHLYPPGIDGSVS